jgi:mRNA guanylyltransferase
MKLEKIKHKLIPDTPIHKIVDEETIMYLKHEMFKYFGISKRNDSFPGAQPISIELKDLPIISKSNYVAGAKLDGERFFMYSIQLPKKLNGQVNSGFHNLTLLIDRTFTFYVVRQAWVHINAFVKQILVDGELTTDGYNVHDVMVVEGNNVMSRDFLTRIKLFDSFLKAGRWNGSSSKRNTFKILLKSFYPISELINLTKSKQFIENSDGIVFYPVKEPVQKRTQFSLFKWKPPGHHTVDFKIELKDGGEIDLVTWDPKIHKEVVFETLIDEDAIRCHYPHESIVEFNIDFVETTGDISFIPLKQRIDKSHGNSKLTIERTIHNVKENITLDRLLKELNV